MSPAAPKRPGTTRGCMLPRAGVVPRARMGVEARIAMLLSMVLLLLLLRCIADGGRHGQRKRHGNAIVGRRCRGGAAPPPTTALVVVRVMQLWIVGSHRHRHCRRRRRRRRPRCILACGGVVHERERLGAVAEPRAGKEGHPMQ